MAVHSERAERAMADARAAGVTVFDDKQAKISEVDGSLRISVAVYPADAVWSQVGAWTGTGTGNKDADGRNTDAILIKEWLKANY